MGISRNKHEDGGGTMSKRSISFSKSFNPIVRKDQYISWFDNLSTKLAQKA